MSANFHKFPESLGNAIAKFVAALRCKAEGRGFDSRWFHWNFSLTQSFRPHYGPQADSASKRNEYQDFFWGGGGGGGKGVHAWGGKALRRER